MGLLILIFFFYGCSALINVNYYYATSSCSGSPVGMDTTSNSCASAPLGPCTGSGKRTECVSTMPSTPSGMIRMSTFLGGGGGSCSGTPFVGLFGIPNTCIVSGASTSYQLTCTGGTMTASSFPSNAICSGSQTTGFPLVNSGGSCAPCGGSLMCQSSCTGGESAAAATLLPMFGMLALLLLL